MWDMALALFYDFAIITLPNILPHTEHSLNNITWFSLALKIDHKKMHMALDGLHDVLCTICISHYISDYTRRHTLHTNLQILELNCTICILRRAYNLSTLTLKRRWTLPCRCDNRIWRQKHKNWYLSSNKK